jgi:5-methylcytosine-specific restriction endonuclease McrA
MPSLRQLALWHADQYSMELPAVLGHRRGYHGVKPAVRRAVWNRDGHRCQLKITCDGKAELSFDEATIDHIRPRSRGGVDAQWNLRCACGPCNHARGNDWEDESR